MEAKYVLYNQNEVPFDVLSLAAFCQEHDLELQAMKDVVRGKSRQHKGWHINEARTQDRAADIDEIEAMFAGTWQPSRGNQFGMPWQPRSTK